LACRKFAKSEKQSVFFVRFGPKARTKRPDVLRPDSLERSRGKGGLHKRSVARDGFSPWKNAPKAQGGRPRRDRLKARDEGGKVRPLGAPYFFKAKPLAALIPPRNGVLWTTRITRNSTKVFVMKRLGMIALAVGVFCAGSAEAGQNSTAVLADPGTAQKMVGTLKSSEASCEAHYPSGGERVCACLSAVTMVESLTSTPEEFTRNSGLVQDVCNKAFRPDLQ
jgi:hypothetical protein